MPEPCCRPPEVTSQVWALSHSIPSPWYGVGMTAVAVVIAVWCALTPRASLRPDALPCAAAGAPSSPGESADEVAWRS